MFCYSTSIGKDQVERDIIIPQKADYVKDINTKINLNSSELLKDLD